MDATPSKYSGLCRAQLSYDYLHTNSTTHEFLFGALAELVDNARDAQAKSIRIYTEKCDKVRKSRILSFLDDGEGMNPEETANIIKFGLSSKRLAQKEQIGQYGNGLKSGSMRVAKDMILFTKCKQTMTCLLLSRSFHEVEGLKEVIVPLPSWMGRSPFATSQAEKDQHLMEMEIILKFSPFNTEEKLMEQFAKIKSETGTLVMLYNLKVLDSGETELDFHTDPNDIRLTDDYLDMSLQSTVSERTSFRAYLSLLYCNPRMKIYLQGKKVLTKRLDQHLFRPKKYEYTSKKFKARSQLDAEEAKKAATRAQEKARELELKARNLTDSSYTSGEGRAAFRQAEKEATDARQEANKLENIAKIKQRALTQPKTLTFIFGFNIMDRSCEGFVVYNCDRLIKMFERSSHQLDGRPEYRGIIGFVNVPHVVLEPTHNKQDFANPQEYRFLLKAMNEHLQQYWRDMKISNLIEFWSRYGYSPSKPWADLPSDESKYAKIRRMKVQMDMQCDACLKWRKIPFSTKKFDYKFTDDWTCQLNWDPARNRCSKPEQVVVIATGHLTKPTPTENRRSGLTTQPPARGRSFCGETGVVVAAASQKRGSSADDSRNVFVTNETPLPSVDEQQQDPVPNEKRRRLSHPTAAKKVKKDGSSCRRPKKRSRKALRRIPDDDDDDVDDDDFDDVDDDDFDDFDDYYYDDGGDDDTFSKTSERQNMAHQLQKKEKRLKEAEKTLKEAETTAKKVKKDGSSFRQPKKRSRKALRRIPDDDDEDVEDDDFDDVDDDDFDDFDDFDDYYYYGDGGDDDTSSETSERENMLQKKEKRLKEAEKRLKEAEKTLKETETKLKEAETKLTNVRKTACLILATKVDKVFYKYIPNPSDDFDAALEKLHQSTRS
ncbi:ATPase MORC2-like isoform X2 [Oscarella lobularis]|uniref:ATPase MORC2-like isoform X2 n=1 Tax=Oscarella lobularis TaxID=121494 RepID=UPI003313166D